MKTKAFILVFITIAAAVTLSFTFGAVKMANNHKTIKASDQSSQFNDAPIGGLAIEDKL
jgi:hypothetical protein